MPRRPIPLSLEPTTQSFIDRLETGDISPIYGMTVDEARTALQVLQAGPVGKPSARIEDTTFPGGPAGTVRVRIVRPSGASEPLPVVMFFHGGAWALGDAATHDRLVREIASNAGAAVVFVEMSRAPEAKYPIPLEEAYAATRHVAERGDALALDGSRIAVAGDGSGATIAAAVTLLAKDRRGPKIAFQVLFYPATDAGCNAASYAAFENGPWLTRSAMERLWSSYLPDATARAPITAAPLGATIDQLRGLPEALVITAENDVLRDEGEAYARNLWEACVRVTATRYLGTIHDFVMLNALADTPAARGALAQAGDALSTALA